MACPTKFTSTKKMIKTTAIVALMGLIVLQASVSGGDGIEKCVCNEGCGSQIFDPDSPTENLPNCECHQQDETKVYNSWDEVKEKRNGTITLRIAGKNRRLPIIATADGKTLLVLQRRFDGSVDFYRNWTDYVNGFGDPEGEFWIGLDLLNLLTSNQKRSLYVFLEDFKNTQVYASYGTFAVAGPEDKYKLKIGGYSGNAGDAMAYQNEMYFSTYDQKNDKWNNNCAVTFHGAWWYNACHTSNLNGLYVRAPGHHDQFAVGMNWKPFRDYYDSMKSAIMALG